MTKRVFIVPFLALSIFIFASCSDDDDDTHKKTIPPQKALTGKPADITAVTSGIIKNRVKYYDSPDVYYEYLSFTSSLAGTYSIYKEDSRTKKLNKLEKFPDVASIANTAPRDGDESSDDPTDSTGDGGDDTSDSGDDSTQDDDIGTVIPGNFSYDAASFVVSITVNDSEAKTYLFKDSGTGVARYITAPQKLISNKTVSDGSNPSDTAEDNDSEEDADSGVDKGSSLFDTWVTSSTDRFFTIKSTGYVTIKMGDNIQILLYGDDDGYLSSRDERAGSNTFFYAKQGEEDVLYYRALIAQAVKSEGRALDGGVIDFNSDRFLFINVGGDYE